MLRAEDWELNYRIRAARRPDLVHPGAARHLPAAGERARPRRAVLPLRPLAPGDRPRAPGDGQLPLPGPAGRGRAGRARPGGGRGRAGRIAAGAPAGVRWLAAGLVHPGHLPGRDHRRRRPCSPAACPRACGSGCRSSSASCTCAGATGFLTSPRTLHRSGEADTRVRSGQKEGGRRSRGRGRMQPWTSTSRRCSRPIAATDTSCTAGT